jgi:hypothetical protein
VNYHIKREIVMAEAESSPEGEPIAAYGAAAVEVEVAEDKAPVPVADP